MSVVTAGAATVCTGKQVHLLQGCSHLPVGKPASPPYAASTGMHLPSPSCYRQPLAISREDTEARLKLGTLGHGPSLHSEQLSH